MTTQAFSANAVNLFLGTPADALTGSMTIRMKTARYYIEGTRLVKDTNYVVTLAWGKMAVEQGWATDISGILPGQDTPAVSGTSGAPDTIIMVGLSSTASNTQRFANYVATANVGDTLIIPAGTWPGDLLINKQIRVLGAGLPRKVGSALVGGTVIVGEINIQDAFSVEVGFLGIDQRTLNPASYPNGITGGTVTVNDSTTELNQYLHDLILLGRGYTGGVGNSQHGVLFQNGRTFICERVTAYNYLNIFVSRASGATFRDCVGYNSEANVMLFKSATAGGANDAFDNTAENCRGYATANQYFANFSSFAEAGATKVTRNSKFVNCTADATGTTGQAMFSAAGTVNNGSNRATLFLGCTSKHADAVNAAFLQNDDFCDLVGFVGCTAEDFTGLSFRSNAVSATNLPVAAGCFAWRNGFPDIINIAGLWAEISVNGKGCDTGAAPLLAGLPAAYTGGRAWARDIQLPAQVGTAAVGLGAGLGALSPLYGDNGTWRVG